MSNPPAPADAPDVDIALAEAVADRRRFGYQPALDGVRAIAVVSVLLYHGGVMWAVGGFLGVDVFFTLSGYLITTLLLLERDDVGGIDLRGFWVRRLRRLLPALLAVVAAVIVYVLVSARPEELERIRGDALAAMFYVANWRFIIDGQSYFDAFGIAPSPLRHTWSLAIEEQWYLFWPIIVGFGYRGARAKDRLWVVGTLAVAAASAVLMVVLFADAADPSRAYYGTDTRAQPLLIGAALAFALHDRTLERCSTLVLDIVGWLSLAGTIVMIVLVADDQAWMYRGGFTLIAVLTAGLIAVLVQPVDTGVRRLLARAPLPVIGRMSYGLYLWHWPIYVVLDEDRTGLDGPALLIVRLAVTTAVSIASYHLIEMPVRRGELRRLAARLSPRHPGEVTALATAVAVLVLAGAVIAATPSSSAQDLAVRGTGDPGAMRVVVIGDSTAAALASGFPAAQHPDVTVINAATLGCGLFDTLPTTESERDIASVERDPACGDLADHWASVVTEYDPDLVVFMTGYWEAYDQAQPGGGVLEVGTPEHAREFSARMQLALDTLTAEGAHVAIVTTPCRLDYRNRWPVDETLGDERRTTVNELMQKFVDGHRKRSSTIDLAGELCPEGELRQDIDGERLFMDGIHLRPKGAVKVWAWMVPELEQLPVRQP